MNQFIENLVSVFKQNLFVTILAAMIIILMEKILRIIINNIRDQYKARNKINISGFYIAKNSEFFKNEEGKRRLISCIEIVHLKQKGDEVFFKSQTFNDVGAFKHLYVKGSGFYFNKTLSISYARMDDLRGTGCFVAEVDASMIDGLLVRGKYYYFKTQEDNKISENNYLLTKSNINMIAKMRFALGLKCFSNYEVAKASV